MTDLIHRLRSVDCSWSEVGEWCAEAADRIEELEAMYNSLGHSSLKVVADLGTKLGTAGARIERLKGYATHKATCEDHGAYPGSCTCGLSRLLKEIGDGQ